MLFDSRPYLFEDKVPYSYYSDLYDHMGKNKPLLIVVSTADHSFKVYFSSSNTVPNHMHSYVFYKKEDAIKYLRMLREKDLGAEIILMEMSMGNLVESYKKVFAKVRAINNTKTYCAYTAVYYRERFVELEVFWSDSKITVC